MRTVTGGGKLLGESNASMGRFYIVSVILGAIFIRIGTINQFEGNGMVRLLGTLMFFGGVLNLIIFAAVS